MCSLEKYYAFTLLNLRQITNNKPVFKVRRFIAPERLILFKLVLRLDAFSEI